MFEKITPERAGISSNTLIKFIKKLEKYEAKTHALFMAKGDKCFLDAYYKPYNKDSLHRMYSQTKSFVGIAIGLLYDEGKLKLSDKIVDYFPDKIDAPMEYLEDLTIEDMLLMSTAGAPIEWFGVEEKDRTKHYLTSKRETHPSKTVWSYDSTGSQVLSSLVERLSGMSLLSYLKKKLFDHMGTFKTAKILKAPNGDSWGDSAMLCTIYDIASFAYLLLNKGMYNGKQLISREYVERACSKIVDNREGGHYSNYHRGYGYQIWRVCGGGFAFVGMGDQLTAVYPEKNLIFSITSDNQGSSLIRELIFGLLEDLILEELSSEPVLENEKAYNELSILVNSLELFSVKGIENDSFQNEISKKVYKCKPNRMGIKSVCFSFDSDTGVLELENEQGKKEIPFGINKNVFGKFPQYGYSTEYGRTKTTNGERYNDCTSLAWLEEKKLMLYTQIIDEYLGNLTMVFGFKGNEFYARFSKIAEDFLNEYEGDLMGYQA
ncbi:MAG: serine hydrolase [Clostridia bacterium]|nr:serine hydrolase [Clostridia bacterium]